MGKNKKHRLKRVLICVGIIAALIAASIGGYAVYGSIQMKKIPALSAKETIDYTLSGSKNGVITVGVIRDGKASYTVYGENGAELQPEKHTYEIGSVTKTVTAALICRAVQEGAVSLDAPIDEYLDLPAKMHYPTIRELLTHTSGYKGYYFGATTVSNFFSGRNDFYGITDAEVLERLAGRDIADKEYGFLYSNFGYAALGLVLERVYGVEYTELVNGYLSGLGLNNTHISRGGDLGGCWDWKDGDAYMAAGALTSDIEDMLFYARALMGGRVCGGENLKPLKEVNATTARYAALGIREDKLAFGFVIDAENNIVWHNGGTGSYNCYLGMDIESGTAVVVLSNLAPGYRIPATVTGVKLLEKLRQG